MKFPKKVKIGGHYYDILVADLDEKAGSDKAGGCYVVKNKIYVNKNYNYSQSQTEESFLHEIIEALNYNYELKLEHEKISILGSTLYQVLKDNKIKFF